MWQRPVLLMPKWNCPVRMARAVTKHVAAIPERCCKHKLREQPVTMSDGHRVLKRWSLAYCWRCATHYTTREAT